MISTYLFYSIGQSKKVTRQLFPDRRVRYLRFPNVFPGVNLRKANAYLLRHRSKGDGVAILGSSSEIDYTIQMLRRHRPNALKMYWYYTEPSAGTVYDCFPKAVLTVAEELGVPIILHVPRIITQCKDELIALCEEFPRLKVCVPHLGSTKFVIDGLAETYRALATSTSIVMDTSLNPNADIIRMALEAFGHERILFGSDQPLNLVRYVPFINPERGQRIVTQFKYHWVDKSEHLQFADLAAGEITHCHWLAINALRQVIDERADADVVKRAIFHDNARLFYGFTL